jgi:hypothetical protein
MQRGEVREDNVTLTKEIPKDRWKSFFEILNRHVGERPIRIEVIGRPLGDQEMAGLLPFRGLAFEPEGSERGTLTVTAGSDTDEVNHRIVGPQRVYTAHNDIGELEWICIEEHGEAGDAQTLIHFEHLPALEATYLDDQRA